MIRFFKWFHGYLLVTIKGYSPERFINLCRNRNILIWNLSKTEDGYDFYISLKAFRDIRPIVKKTHTRPVIRERFGFPFFLHGFRKRKAFVAGLCLFAAILYGMSLFIWDIGIEGQYEHTQEALLKYLKETDVYPGRMKKDLNCQDIEEALRNHYKDIGWVSAEIKGTKLLIKLVETNMPVPIETATEPCHIVASHDGIVTSIVTRKGRPLVKKGDEVKKGDILISGVLEIIGDNDILLRKEPVIADGDITIQTRYPYSKSFSMNYINRNFTGETSTAYGISFFNKNFFFIDPLKKFKSYEKYDIIITEKNLRLNASFVLPVSIFKKEYVECREERSVYTKEEAFQIAKNQLSLYMEHLKEKGVVILENNVLIRVSETKNKANAEISKSCAADGYLLVEEQARELKNVQNSEWRITETNEPGGNEN